jgi:ubiquinone/menaquinone biosynthesis C-methylase UbiE
MHRSLGTAVYTLGSSPKERERLRQQSADLRSHSVTLLDQVELGPGGSAIDLGCGPSGALDLLADRVGPNGQVTGLDSNPTHVALARSFAREFGLNNVTVVESDARRTGLPAASFDLAHGRLLLINIPVPEEVVQEMVRLVRPAGWVVADEADTGFPLCYPPHPAWNRLCEIFVTSYQQDGADPYIGRRLPELFRRAGLVDVGVEARADVHPIGHARRTLVPDLVRSMRPKILERGLAGEQELRELDRTVRRHLADRRTLVIPFLYFLTWGRKPEASGHPRIN